MPSSETNADASRGSRRALIEIPQAIFERIEHLPPTLRLASSNFTLAWIEEAKQLILDFGEKPTSVPCPLIIFAYPLTKQHVVVVRVREDGAGLWYHLLVLDQNIYQILGDPFELAQRFPPDWQAQGTLPNLSLPHEPLPARTLAQVQEVLKRVKASALREDEDPNAPDFERTPENSESPALLGGVQILVDGGKLVFRRPAGDLALLSGLWKLLPTRLQGRLWPASFAFNHHLDFDVLTVPIYVREDFEGYTTEEEAADYPAGSYELALQSAAETNDPDELERIFERRTGSEVLRLAIMLLTAMVLIVGLSSLFQPRIDPTQQERQEQAAIAAGIVASSDLWIALGFYEYGKVRWGAPKEKQ